MNPSRSATPALATPSTPPLSPSSRAFLATLTTLYEEEPWPLTMASGVSPTVATSLMDITAVVPERSYPTTTPTPDLTFARHASAGTFPTRIQKRKKRPHLPESASASGIQIHDIPGLGCYRLATGEPGSAPKRAKYTYERRVEVKTVRNKGACLRCQIQKRRCSGEDPCRECVLLAQAKMNSRKLQWMECLRPSFQDMTIFTQVPFNAKPAKYEELSQRLLHLDDEPVIGIPFEISLNTASNIFAKWLVDGTNYSQFSIAGLLRSGKLGSLLEDTLGPTARDAFHLMIYLTNDVVARSSTDTYQGYSTTELTAASHHAGNMVLSAVESLLQPQKLASSRTKLQDLQTLFLVVFGISITARYTFLHMIIRGHGESSDFKRRTEALIRLLNHYLIWISGLLKLTDNEQHEQLAQKCGFTWDKPGSYTREWTEDHGRNDSRLSWGNPGEHMISKNMDSLHSFERTMLPDHQECRSCNFSRSILDSNGLCEHCRPFFSQHKATEVAEKNFHGFASIVTEAPRPSESDLSIPAIAKRAEAGTRKERSPRPSTRKKRKNNARITQENGTALHSGMKVAKIQTTKKQSYFGWGHAFGRISALSSSYYTPPLHHNAIVSPNDDSADEDEEPLYWTFFNQNKPFTIQRQANNRVYTNNATASSSKLKEVPQKSQCTDISCYSSCHSTRDGDWGSERWNPERYDSLEPPGWGGDFPLTRATDEWGTEFQDWLRDPYQTEEVYAIGGTFMTERS